MNLTLRLGRPDDADRCGTIFYEAFKAIAEYHGFPRDSSGPERGIANFARWLSDPGHHVILAELDGYIVGSNVLDERSNTAHPEREPLRRARGPRIRCMHDSWLYVRLRVKA